MLDAQDVRPRLRRHEQRADDADQVVGAGFGERGIDAPPTPTARGDAETPFSEKAAATCSASSARGWRELVAMSRGAIGRSSRSMPAVSLSRETPMTNVAVEKPRSPARVSHSRRADSALWAPSARRSGVAPSTSSRPGQRTFARPSRTCCGDTSTPHVPQRLDRQHRRDRVLDLVQARAAAATGRIRRWGVRSANSCPSMPRSAVARSGRRRPLR